MYDVGNDGGGDDDDEKDADARWDLYDNGCLMMMRMMRMIESMMMTIMKMILFIEMEVIELVTSFFWYLTSWLVWFWSLNC